MKAWSRLFREHRTLATLLVVLALCIKALVPTGYMISPSSRVITVEVCGATSTGAEHTRQLVILHDDHGSQDKSSHTVADSACAWTVLSMAALTGVDPDLLASALALILILGLLPQAVLPRSQTRFLRPPLRGPPVHT